MLLLVDNYDSFTWNLVQAFQAAALEIDVVRNDRATSAELLARAPEGLVIGPGPGRPSACGVGLDLLRDAPDRLPILGVCLGHQALVEHYGGRVREDPVPVHGRASRVQHSGRGLFAGLPQGFEAGRYHSLCAARECLPSELELDAWTDDGVVMAVRHRWLPRYGVQFHPESILTPAGELLLARFAELCGLRPRARERALLRASPRAQDAGHAGSIDCPAR